MSPAPYALELRAAMAASREAAAAIRVRFGRGDAVRYKTPIEPVTEADMVADRILSARLRRRFPEDGWLSEEGVDSSDRLGRRRVWIVDPLDGTREFITGRPEFCVSVALVEDGQVVVGVVVNPVTGDRWAARLGCGATLNGRPIHVRECNDLQGGPIVVSRSELTRGVLEPWRSLPLHPAGGMANKLVLVAMGSAVATFTPRMRHEWDLVGGALIVTEAGGRITRLDGKPLVYNRERPRVVGVVASSPGIHDALVRAVRG